MNIPYRNLVCALAVLGLMTAAPMALAQTHRSHSAEKQSDQSAAATSEDAATAPTSTRSHTWEEIDADGDGAITKAEARADAGLSTVFDEADADADGRLTTAEYTAYIQKRSDAAATQNQGGTGKPH